jgi:methyltransferase (TIGR00027 family)
MHKSPIQHVSDTAFWVAAYRALESERKDPLFIDPLAARLVEGRGQAIAQQMGDAAAMSWSIAVRTRLIDEYIREALLQGYDAVLNLGAGLDTRPYRLELPASLQWIEVDFAATIQFKKERLQAERPRCQLRRVALDLGDVAARAQLFAEVGAGAQKVLILTEGVVPYLSCEEASSLALALHKEPHFQLWIIDYYSPTVRKLTRFSKRRRQMQQAPFKFHPPDWEAFFATRGFALRKIRYMVEEGMHLGRMPPTRWWLKLLFRLAPASFRESVRRMIGYALLERRAGGTQEPQRG